MLNMPSAPGEHPVYTLLLPDDARGPAVARATLRAVLHAHGMRQLAATATLLAGELVTNSYEHAKGSSAMCLRLLPDRLRVSVWDADPQIPGTLRTHLDADAPSRPSDAELCAERGRGLLLVQCCADRWGGFALDSDAPTRGKLLWFELAA